MQRHRIPRKPRKPKNLTNWTQLLSKNEYENWRKQKAELKAKRRIEQQQLEQQKDGSRASQSVETYASNPVVGNLDVHA
jgi:hypothetical protein